MPIKPNSPGTRSGIEKRIPVISPRKRQTDGKTTASADKRILNAAETLFISRGFDGVSVNDVAARARVNKALVFYYFKTKQNLFNTVLDNYYQAQARALMQGFEGQGSFKDRIHAGVEAYLDLVEKNPGYPKLIQREVCSGSGSLDKIVEYMAPLERWGTGILGGLLPPSGPLSARHFFISLFGMIINYYTYAPALRRIWNSDPMAASALIERREHIHAAIDALLNVYVSQAESRL